MQNDNARPDWWPVDGEISAIDLSSEKANAEARGIEVEATRFNVHTQWATCDAIYFPSVGRAGVSLGADAVWTDATSLADGIERVLSGDVIR
jgi:hypothetical protein